MDVGSRRRLFSSFRSLALSLLLSIPLSLSLPLSHWQLFAIIVRCSDLHCCLNEFQIRHSQTTGMRPSDSDRERHGLSEENYPIHLERRVCFFNNLAVGCGFPMTPSVRKVQRLDRSMAYNSSTVSTPAIRSGGLLCAAFVSPLSAFIGYR